MYIMPYHNRRNRYRQKLTVRNLDKRIDKLEEEQELKYHIVSIGLPADNTPDSGGSSGLVLLNGMADGDNNELRTGNQIVATSLRIRGHLISQSEPVNNIHPVQMRIIIFWYVLPEGRTPQIIGSAQPDVDSLLVPDAVGNPVNYMYNFDTVVNARSFQIVYDKTYTFNPRVAYTTSTTDATPAISTGTGYVPWMIEFNKKFKFNKKCSFAASTGNPTSFTRNSLWMTVFSNEADEYPSISFTSQLVFKDPQ